MSVRTWCVWCRTTWTVLGSDEQIKGTAEQQVGHPMPSLAIAIGHIECPKCKQVGTLRPREPVA